MEKRRKDAPAPEAAAGFVPVGQSRTQAVGLFIEWRETQMALIVLILLDVAAATIGIMLDLQPKTIVPSFVVYALQSLSGFTQVLFVLEITALVWVFQLALFSHVGYCIDFGVVVFSLTWEFQRQSKVVRILGLLRLWRVFRLVETYLNDERVQHQATAALLEAEQQLTAKHALRIQILEDALEKEYQAKAQLNQVLQEYKDEIDTLKEALEIAALSVMQDKDDEEEEKEEEDICVQNSTLKKQPIKSPGLKKRTNQRLNFDHAWMAKTAALSLPSTSWQNQVQPVNQSSAGVATTAASTSSSLPLCNNNVDGPSDEDMLQKMERMGITKGRSLFKFHLVSNRSTRGRKSTNIDTSSSSGGGSSSRLNARLLTRGPSSTRTMSPRLQPLGNQGATISPEECTKISSSSQDDDESDHIQLPRTSTSTVQNTSNKEPRMDKLETITISARSPSPSIVVMGKSSSSRGAVGLQNLGNTCFMNSCIQCLSNVGAVVKHFRSNSHLNELNETSPTHGKLACVFGDLIQTLWSSAEFSSTRPVELKRVVGKLASRFVGYDQHDAQEFLRFLLDGLHEDLNRIIKKPPYYEIPDRPNALERDVSDEYWQYYFKRNQSALSDHFCGQLRSEVTCQTCNHRSICFDVFWDLSLPVPKKPKSSAIRFGTFKSSSAHEDKDDASLCSIQDCLRAYTEEEHLKEEDAFYCSKCKTHRSVIKKICLQRCPNVLVLHLKRFSYSTFSRDKVSTSVKFPTEGLDLKEFCSKDNGLYDKCWEYDLIGMIHHMGTLNGGHYTAECRNPENGNWYDFNDETVSAVKKPPTASSSAYILFYQRCQPGPKGI